MNRRLSASDPDSSPKDLGGGESHINEMLARFGPNRHTFNEQDRAKAVDVRRRKAEERKIAAMTVPEFLRDDMDRHPEKWARVYMDGRDKGELAAVEAGLNRAYGRPAQALTINQVGIDIGELEPGDLAELERLVLERLTVTKSER